MDKAHAFCEFVLSEGIMPAPIVRALNEKPEYRNDINLILNILVHRGNVQNVIDNNITDEITDAMFDADLDLINWLEEHEKGMEYILESANTVVVNTILSNMIKTCYLVASDRKDKYLSPVENLARNIVKLHSSNKNPQIAKFENMLIAQNKSSLTIQSYVSSMNSLFKNYGVNIWGVTNLGDFNSVINKLEQMEFPRSDAEKIARSALKVYRELLISGN